MTATVTTTVPPASSNEPTDEEGSIGWAITMLSNGVTLRRSGWSSLTPSIVMEDDVLVRYFPDNVRVVYRPTADDILSSDWAEVE